MKRDKTPRITICDIVTPGYEGWANVIVDPSGYCIGMVRPEVAVEVRKALNATKGSGG